MRTEEQTEKLTNQLKEIIKACKPAFDKNLVNIDEYEFDKKMSVFLSENKKILPIDDDILDVIISSKPGGLFHAEVPSIFNFLSKNPLHLERNLGLFFFAFVLCYYF